MPRFGARAALLLLACAALVVAVLDPAVRREQPVFQLMVTIDITQSMNTLDYRVDGRPVSRLAYVKRALADLLRQLPCGSRIGWAIFTEYRSFLLLAPVEVCANYRELAAALARIDGRMAWAGASEVAKGLYSGLLIAKDLEGRPDLVFISDGQEAPPINPRYRPIFTGKPNEVGGVVLGAGADALSTIPKFDADGNSLGVWKADEVMQTDPRSTGRSGSVAGEALVDTDPAPPAIWMPPPGREHLSSLREPYLQLLATETGLRYHRLVSDRGLRQQLTPLARPAIVATSLRQVLGLSALLLLAAAHARWPMSRRYRWRFERFSRWRAQFKLWRRILDT